MNSCLNTLLLLARTGEKDEVLEVIRLIAIMKKAEVRGANAAIRRLCSMVTEKTPELEKELVTAVENICLSRSALTAFAAVYSEQRTRRHTR